MFEKFIMENLTEKERKYLYNMILKIEKFLNQIKSAWQIKETRAVMIMLPVMGIMAYITIYIYALYLCSK